VVIQAERVAERSRVEPVSAEVISMAVREANRPLRICLLGYRSHPYGGGQGIYIKYLSKALVQAGHSVEVVSGAPYPHLDPRVKLIKLPGMDLYDKGLMSLRPHHVRSWANCREWWGKLTGSFSEPLSFGMRAASYLKRHGHRYDLIHDNQCLAYGMLKVQQRQPLVTTIHHPITSDREISLAATDIWWHKLFVRRWYSFLGMQKYVAKRLYHLVTVSATSQHDIAEAFGVSEQDIQLVYNGIDTEIFAPRPQIQRRPLRIMATASADAPLKGVRYLIEAFAALLPRYPDLELLMVSKPQPAGETAQLVEKLDLGAQITFVSGISTEELVQHYAEATLVVVPSVYEGFGLPAGEAMACGVPVVSTVGGALPEVVGDAGLLVPIRDSQALAEAISRLLDDDKLQAQLATEGRERILEKFCWNVSATQMTQYYREVIAQYANS
jgi:glycosyltransferase involved in cell wall biosynthesis